MTITLDPTGVGDPLKTEHALLYRISWDTYRDLCKAHEDRPLPRLTFVGGMLEIVGVNSAFHEFLNRLLASLIEILAEEWAVNTRNVGSVTLQRSDLEQGLEPDTAFYIQNAQRMAGRNDVVLDDGDPAPDLVIEIDYTSYSLDKLPLYADCGVSEVWRYTRRDRVIMLRLNQGVYEEIAISAAFPALTSEQLNILLEEGRTRERLDWVRLVRQWARQTR